MILAGSDSEGVIKLVFFLAAVGGTFVYKAVKNHKRVRNIQDTPRSKIASAPQGFVELEGFAWPKTETVTTIHDQEAIYYHFELQRLESRGSGKNRRSEWVKVYSYTHCLPFFLLDPTGVAVVNPENAELELCPATTLTYSKLSPDEQQRVQSKVGSSVSDFPPRTGFMGMFSSNFRVVEKSLLLGSPIYASGNFRTDSHNQVTIDDALATFANKVINFQSRSFKDVTRLLDKDGDGKVSEQEALQGYTTAAKISRKSPERQAAPIDVHGTLGTTENHKLFFSDKHEAHLTESLKRYAGLKLFGGAGMVTASILIALTHFGILPDFSSPSSDSYVASTASSASSAGQESRKKHASGTSSSSNTKARVSENETEAQRLIRLERESIEAARQAQRDAEAKAILAVDPARQQFEERIQEIKRAQVADFHQRCVGGAADACRELIAMKDELKLDANYLKYYHEAGCRHGDQSLCEVSRTMSSVGEAAQPASAQPAQPTSAPSGQSASARPAQPTQ